MTNQNPQYINSYFSQLLYYHSFSNFQWDYEAAELQAFQMFRNSDWFAPSIPTMTPDGSFNTPIKNVQLNQGIPATSVASATVANGLDITFTDPTLATMRIKDKVVDNLGFEGYVWSAAPGKVSIAPVGNPAVLVAGTHFKTGFIMRDVGNISATFNSVGTTTLYHQKDVQTDWTEITRNTAQIARMEKMNLFQANTPKGEEVFYGFTDTEANTFNDFIWQCCYKYMFGYGSTGLNLLDGTASKTMGIRNRIIQSSGNYLNTGAAITQQDFENMLFQSFSVQPNFGQDIYVFPGIRAARQLSTFYPSATAFAAASNERKTVDLALQTGDIYIAGNKVKIVTNFGLLNSAKIQDWNKDSVYILNMSPTIMQGRNAKLVQLIHSSNDPNSTQMVLRKETPGMTGSGSNNNTGMGNIGQNEVTTSPVDGTTIEFEDHSGIAMIGKGQGLFEWPR